MCEAAHLRGQHMSKGSLTKEGDICLGVRVQEGGWCLRMDV